MKVEMKREAFNEIIKILNDEREKAASASLVQRAGQLGDLITEMIDGGKEGPQPVPKKTKLMEKEDALDKS